MMTATLAPNPIAVAQPSPLISLTRPWFLTRWAIPPATIAVTEGAALALEAHALPASIALTGSVAAVLATSRLSGTVGRERLTGGALAALCASSAPLLPAHIGYSVAAVGGLAAGLPWLPRSARRVQRRRIHEIRAAWPAVVAQADLPAGTELVDVAPTATGWRLWLRTPRGFPADLVADRSRRIAAALGRGTVRVFVSDADASRCSVEVTEGTDPLAAGTLPRPGETVATIRNGAPFGIDARGRTVTLPVVESSGLIGGRPGGGKSVGLSLVAAAAVEAPDAELWAVDLKRGVELAPWLNATTRAATTPEAAAALFGALEATMADRLDALASSGSRKHRPSPEDPLIVLLVDELAELDKDTFAQLRRILSLGRAAGISVWAATQRPSADLVPTAVRGLFRLAISYPVRRRSDSEVILGQGWAAEGVDASTLSAPGLAWLIADGGPTRLKSYYLDDADIGRLVAQHTGTGRKQPEPPPRPETPENGPAFRTVPEPSGTNPPHRAQRATTGTNLDGHPGWKAAGGYALALHRSLTASPSTAAAAARAVGCSDKHARSALARLATVGLAARIGTQWEALPASIDALEALEGGAR